jgi:hypothetical protein
LAYLRRSILVVATAVLVLFHLSACNITPDQTTVQGGQSGGSISPDAVARGFFEDLSKALKDPQLSDDKRRGEWVERLAVYFAPNERDDQRIALREALDSFITGLGKLETNEHLTLDLRFEDVEKIEETSNRAVVRPINGAIYVLITRTTDAGVQNIYEETVPLDRLIGNNGTVPVIRIGRTWYLTEG